MSEVTRLIKGLDRDGIRPIVVASHPRCGTHLLIDTLRLNCPETRGWKFPGERRLRPARSIRLRLILLRSPSKD